MEYRIEKIGDLNSGNWEYAIYQGRKQICALNMAINPFNNDGIGPFEYAQKIVNALNQG